ncbi:MAG: ABC transporter permease subunit [Kiloniellales bacterium]|nr:ABC transporter permease subunit [Kiloniellales bacterium]
MRRNRSETFLLTVTCFAFAFLYVPILLLIFYSFNDSRLVTVWGGFSTKWYFSLWENDLIIAAILLSLRIAVVSASIAVIMGTLAGIALSRFGRFRGRMMMTGMVTAPLVMPEVITGLSLLLLFISLEAMIGWPEGRGVTTITIAHITFSMAYVAVIVQSRLSGMDESLEEAAMDLGAKPPRVMFDITIPLLAPAMVSGWLLAFTLSLDDLVIASFVSGPGSSTLPMVIYSKVKLGVTPDINALATIIIVTVTLGVIGAGILINSHDKRRKREEQMAYATALEEGT